MNLLERLAEEAKKRARGITAQVNTRDGGQTYSTVVNNKRPTPRPAQATGVLAPKYNPAMQPRRNTSVANSVRNASSVYGTALKRSAIGGLQGISGLVDLATPGTGTSRVSKSLDRSAQQADAQAKKIAPNNPFARPLYMSGQLAGDALQFGATGKALSSASKVVSKVPGVTKTAAVASKITAPVANATNRGIAKVAQKGTGGRIAATGLRAGTNPSNVANMAAGTGLDLGAEASKGRDISKADVAIATGANVGLGVGLPMLGKAGMEVAGEARKRIFNNASKTVKPQTIDTRKLTPEDAAGYSDLDPIRVSHYKNEIANGRGTEPIIAMKGKGGRLLVEDGKHRLQAFKELGIPTAPVKVVTAKELKSLAQNIPVGMSSKMVDANGNPTTWKDVKARRSASTQVAPELTQPQTKTLTEGSPPLPPAVQAQAAMAEPPKAPLAVAAPAGKATRYASKTVPESEFVSEAVSQKTKENAPLYSPETEKARYTEALGKIDAAGLDQSILDVKAKLNAKNISSQDVADAQSVAAMLDAAGDPRSLQDAADIYDALSEKLTKAGQTVQAAAILARRTPDGLRFHAQRTLDKAGVKLTPELQTQLNALIETVRKTDPATELGKQARFAVTDFVTKNTPSSFSDRLMNFWRAGLLTAPTTTAGNLLGNTSETIIRKGFVNPVAILADQAIGAFTGQRSIASSGLGYAKGAVEGTGKLGTFLKTGYDERNALSKYDTQRTNYKNKVLDKYVNGVYKLMSTADQPFWYGARKEALQSIAKAEAINNQIPRQQQKKWINDFMANPPEDAAARAAEDAAFATFQNKTGLGQAAVGVKDAFNKMVPGLGDFVIPFTQVPASIATRIITRTPVGTAAEVVRQFVNIRKGGKFDQRKMAQSIGEGGFGMAVLGAGYSLANSGLMTFSYPTDQRERQLWEAEGKQPYSVNIDGRWYSLNYIQPFGTLLAVGSKAGEKIEEGESLLTAVGAAAGTAGQSLANQSFVKGISGVIDAALNPDDKIKAFINQTGQSIVPNFIRSFARSIDPLQREQEGFVEGIKQGIPGVRESTTPKMDAFGQPLEAKDNFANQYLNPLRPSLARDDNPVAVEARRLQEIDAGVLPSKANKTSLGKETELDKKQITELDARIGGAVNEAWAKLIEGEGYSSLTDDEKAKALKKISSSVASIEKHKYAQEKGIAYKPSGSALPKSYDQLDTAVKSFYDAKLGTNTDEAWERATVDEPGKDLIRRVNQIRAEGMPELPATNKVASLYADFVATRAEQKWSKTREVQEKRKLLKAAYKSELSEDDSFWLTANDGLFRQAIDAGDIGQETLDKLVAYDNLSVQLGGSQQVGKKLRSLLGIAQPPTASGSGRSTSKQSRSFNNPIDILTKFSTRGANIARTATLKK